MTDVNAGATIAEHVKIMAVDALLEGGNPRLRFAGVCASGDVIGAADQPVDSDVLPLLADAKALNERVAKAAEAMDALQAEYEVAVAGYLKESAADLTDKLDAVTKKLDEAGKPFVERNNQVIGEANSKIETMRKAFDKSAAALRAKLNAEGKSDEVIEREVLALQEEAIKPVRSLREATADAIKKIRTEFQALMAVEIEEQQALKQALDEKKVEAEAHAEVLLEEKVRQQAAQNGELESDSQRVQAALNEKLGVVEQKAVARVAEQCKANAAKKPDGELAEVGSVWMRSAGASKTPIAPGVEFDLYHYQIALQCTNGKGVNASETLPFSAVDEIGSAPSNFAMACKMLGEQGQSR